MTGTHQSRRLDEVALGCCRGGVLTARLCTRCERRTEAVHRLLECHQTDHAGCLPRRDRGRRQSDRPGRAATTARQHRSEADFGNPHHLGKQGRVAAEPEAVQRQAVDVANRQAGILEGGQRRLAGQLERRLGDGLAAPVVRGRADADDRGLVLQGEVVHRREGRSVRLGHGGIMAHRRAVAHTRILGRHGSVRLGRARRVGRMARVHADGILRGPRARHRRRGCGARGSGRRRHALPRCHLFALGHDPRSPRARARRRAARPAGARRAHHDAREREPRRHRARRGPRESGARRHTPLLVRVRRRISRRTSAQDRVPVLGEPRSRRPDAVSGIRRRVPRRHARRAVSRR